MKKIILLFWYLLLGSFLCAQEIQKDIDQEIWKPFCAAWNQAEASLFNQLHSKEVLRAGDSELKIGEEYRDANQAQFARVRKEKLQRSIALAFLTRAARENKAYETGIYRIRSQMGDLERDYYGYFHVVLEKIGGKWKIIQDWDSGEVLGEKVNEKHFMMADRLE